MGSIYNTSLNTMAKTRTITATFSNGDQITRKTARTYTHVVRAYSTGYYPDEPNTERCWFEKWCGRPDLMQKQVQIAKNSPNKNTRIEVAEITNDPWAA